MYIYLALILNRGATQRGESYQRRTGAVSASLSRQLCLVNSVTRYSTIYIYCITSQIYIYISISISIYIYIYIYIYLYLSIYLSIYLYIYIHIYWSTSQLCAQGVPTLMGSMKKQKDARNVFRLALCITLLIYVLLCFTTNYYFGPRILPIITLNWQDYTDGARVGITELKLLIALTKPIRE